jgi:GxxExxY protein
MARSWYSGGVRGRPSASDILANETVILEIKAVPVLLPVDDMQLQTYLRMSGLSVGLRRFVG